MKYSQLFPKTEKTAPHEEVAVNAKFLIMGGFIDKLMSGSYTLLPLGKRVEEKIQEIIREEMNATGAQEMLLPLIHPKEIWNETGRWDKAREIMYQFKKDDREFALSFTHEEIFLDLVRKHLSSYKDLPIKLYQFTTKFRDEARAKSGILRAREFIMKDLYSLHATKEDFENYYEIIKEVYLKAFKRLGLEAKIVEAAGGVFTENVTHEFQVLTSVGEDTIYYCEKCDFAQNKEIAKVKDGDLCPKCSSTHSTSSGQAGSGQVGKIIEAKSIEVGNIFPFGTDYCEKMNVTFTDEKGQKQYPYFGSYGIGPTRVMGTIVEMHNDDKGIIWPESVAPFRVNLISLGKGDYADKIYNGLLSAGVEVLYDDRDKSAGEKFADADLIGIPYRFVVSEKTGEKVEVKKRNEEKTEILTLEETIKYLEN